MSEAIKPCPFCGGTDVVIDEGTTHRWYVARCDRCGAQAGEARVPASCTRSLEQRERDIKASALAEWNARATPEQESGT